MAAAGLCDADELTQPLSIAITLENGQLIGRATSLHQLDQPGDGTSWKPGAADPRRIEGTQSPLLAIRFDHMPRDEWLMVMHSEDWTEFDGKINARQGHKVWPPVSEKLPPK